MQRRQLIKGFAAMLPSFWLAKGYTNNLWRRQQSFGEQITDGPFKPAWDSLAQYKVLGWFQDAKFGIWAHWGAQCQPEHGDWYARGMYEEGSDHYKFHCGD